ncbi:hypothetical protein HPB50_012149 [Hyalomma asiaticum]|uniref:Uncharacterized protein n=1 Tax=Hyalomma asiaticum TaxID=266040 RepID=A0ACB7SES0_HYAAI|nr:hypothetical protein HPB50_012149 [Hyalomma asiaticum]
MDALGNASELKDLDVLKVWLEDFSPAIQLAQKKLRHFARDQRKPNERFSMHFNKLHMRSGIYRYDAASGKVIRTGEAENRQTKSQRATTHNAQTNESPVSQLLANFRSIFPKLDSLKAIIHSTSSYIILSTETWLSDDINSSDLAFPLSSVIFRKDRTVSGGGGVLIAVKEFYEPSIIAIDSPLEALWVSLKFGHLRCVLGVCYRPPDRRTDFAGLFNEALELVTNRFRDCLLLIGGDSNYSH